MPDLLTPPANPPAPAGGSPAPTPAGTPAPAPAGGSPAPAPQFSNELPDNWFLAGGDAFAAEAETLSRFKNVTDLAKSYVHLRKQGPSFPGETATPEEVERFRALAQVPAAPELYGVQPPADLPEGVQWDGETLKEFAKVAHANHVPAPAFKALVDAFTATEAAKIAAMKQAEEQQFAAAQQQIWQELGGNQVDFQRNAAAINHTVAVLADQAGIDPADPSLAALRTNPAMIKILHQVTKMTAEDPTRTPAGYGDLRGDYEKGMDIIEGRDPQWSKLYAEGDSKAVARVAQLLSKKK